jgi:hypothetical protein
MTIKIKLLMHNLVKYIYYILVTLKSDGKIFPVATFSSFLIPILNYIFYYLDYIY